MRGKTFFNTLLIKSVLLVCIITYSCSKSSNPIVTTPIVKPPASMIDYLPEWSNDGSKIIYNHSDPVDSLHGIYIINPDGTDKKQVVRGLYLHASFSPDGNWFCFCGDFKIYKIKTNGDSLTLLASGRTLFPTWSKDGRYIVYDDDNSDSGGVFSGSYIMRNDGSEKRRISGGGFPSWHPNSRITISVRFQSFMLKAYPFENRNADTIKLPKYVELWFPKFSPDGSQIIYCAEEDSDLLFKTFIMNADGSNIRKLPIESQSWFCNWSPDGNHIVYTNAEVRNGRLWIMNKDGSNKRQLTY